MKLLSGFEGLFDLEKMKSGNAVVCLLKEQFERQATSPRSTSDCEWVADCLYQLEQYHDAGGWYEMAGGLILSGSSAPTQIRALSALGPYERALECYALSKDDESFEEISELTRALKRACASA